MNRKNLGEMKREIYEKYFPGEIVSEERMPITNVELRQMVGTILEEYTDTIISYMTPIIDRLDKTIIESKNEQYSVGFEDGCLKGFLAGRKSLHE